jgi:DNA-binding transcriptional regulator GbsR (MarR family)
VLPVSRPAVSQHLKVLKGAGLVVDRPAGTRRIYQLDSAGVGALRAYLDRFWTKALAAYKEAVEQSTKELSEHTGSSDLCAERDRRRGADRACVLGLH